MTPSRVTVDKKIYRMGAGYAMKDGKLAKNKAVTKYNLADYGGMSGLEMINPNFISGVKAKQLDKTLSIEYNGQGKQLVCGHQAL